MIIINLTFDFSLRGFRFSNRLSSYRTMLMLTRQQRNIHPQFTETFFRVDSRGLID